MTPLMKAAFKGYAAILELLLKHGAKIDIQDNKGFSALMSAAQEGQEICVKILVDHGASVNLVNSQNVTALMLAVFFARIDVVKFLKKAGTNVDNVGVSSTGNRATATDFANSIAAEDPVAAKAMLHELEKVCVVCRSGMGSMMRCGDCLSVFYCSAAHQLEHWPLHKGAACDGARAKRRLQEKAAAKEKKQKNAEEKKEKEQQEEEDDDGEEEEDDEEEKKDEKKKKKIEPELELTKEKTMGKKKKK